MEILVDGYAGVAEILYGAPIKKVIKITADAAPVESIERGRHQAEAQDWPPRRRD